MIDYLILSPSICLFRHAFIRHSRDSRFGLYVDYRSHWIYVDIVNQRVRASG